MQKRMLLIFAHPDDESFVLGGTVAKMASEGVDIHLVTATRGEAGKTAGLCAPEELGELREKELRRAVQVLGIHELSFLGYRDKELPMAPAVQILEQLVKKIRAFKPHVVVTFGADGASGHRDHRAIHYWTKSAVRLSSQQLMPEWGEPYAVPRLCYVKATWQISDREKAESDFAIDISQFADTKWKGIQEHKTQAQSIEKFAKMIVPYKESYFKEEFFHCDLELSAFPGKGNDLFAGLTMEE